MFQKIRRFIVDTTEILFWRIEDFFRTIRSWFRHNFNKDHFKTIQTAFKGYPFDYCYLLSLEYYKLKEMLAYFEKSRIIVEEERLHIIQWIKYAIKCLEIMEDPSSIVEFQYDKENLLLLKRCKVTKYVNLKNGYRFTQNGQTMDFYKNFPEELYASKARHLYYEIRKRYTDEWWD